MGAMHLVFLIFSLIIAFSHANSRSITELLEKGGLTTFLSLINKTGAIEAYNSALDKKGLTLFAPSNEIFTNPLVQESLKKLTPDQVVSLLKYHAVGEYLPIGALNGQISTLATDEEGKYILKVTSDDGRITVVAEENRAEKEETIYNLKPLLILKIDNVLHPSALFGKPSSPSGVNMSVLLEKDGCATFASLIGLTKVIDTYLAAEKDGGVTIFAPSDEAFKDPELPDLKKLTPDQVVALLKYHGVGDYLTIGKLMETKEPISTLATDDNGNNFILKASLDVGETILIAEKDMSRIEQTIIDDNLSLAIFKINKVLLPALGESPPPAGMPENELVL